MADAKSLFDEGEDISHLFESGEEVVPATPTSNLSYTPESHEYSPSEAAGLSFKGTPTGLPQGLSLGFGDEIGALSGALGASTGGDPRGFWDIYGNIRDTLREEGAQAQEQQPVAAIGGELAGGLLVPIGAGGAAAKAAQVAGNEAKALSALQNIGKMAATGAKAGAVAGLGTSQADLTQGELGQAGKDIATGALTGAGTGAVLQGAGEGIKKVASSIKSFPLFGAPLRARDLAKQGYEMLGKSENISQEARDKAYSILDKLETLRSFTGSLLGKSKEEADKVLGKINIKEALGRIEQEIAELKPIGSSEKEDIAQLHQVLDDIAQEVMSTTGQLEVSPGQLSSHLQSIRDVPINTSKGQRGVGMAQQELKGAQGMAAEAVGPEGTQALDLLKGSSESFGNIKDVQKSLGLPESGRVSDLNPKRQKSIVSQMQDAILKLSEGGESKSFSETMKELADEFPEASKEILDTAKNISERYQLSNLMESSNISGAKHLGLSVPAFFTRGGEIVGRTEKGIKDIGTKLAKGVSGELVDLGKKIHNSSPEQIQQLAEMAAQKGTTFGQMTAKTLSNIVNAPMAKRRAVLFTLMQQPDFREFAKGMFTSESE